MIKWFWISVLAFICIFFYLFEGMLLPFGISFILAYALWPISQKTLVIIQSRSFVSAILTLALVFLFLFSASIVIPSIENELFKLARKIPAYYEQVVSIGKPFLEQSLKLLPEDKANQFEKELLSYASQSIGIIASFIMNLISNGRTLAGIISTVFIVPIALFYLLRDWPNVISGIETWIPRSQLPIVLDICSRINNALGKYIKGQSIIACILSFYYAFSLYLLGIESAFVLGGITGILSFAPFIGALISFAISLLICVVQFESLSKAIWLVVIYLAGQFMEGHILYPKFIGKGIGLHPLWILFALFAGTELKGVLGMIIAIPAASIISVFINYGLEKFQSSSLYKN